MDRISVKILPEMYLWTRKSVTVKFWKSSGSGTRTLEFFEWIFYHCGVWEIQQSAYFADNSTTQEAVEKFFAVAYLSQ